jgi:DNA-binding NarL/FixJ family response regulator
LKCSFWIFNWGPDRGEALFVLLRSTNATLSRIVVLSAQPMPDLIRAARIVGAEAFLQKPCSIQRLLDAIELAVA